MLFMAPIVFVGIVGSHHDAVEHQLAPSLDKNGITEMAIPDGERAAILKHTPGAKQVVKSLHAGGVIAGQLGGAGATRTFRLVIYDADGNLTSDLESPIGARGLTKGNIQAFEINISDIVATVPHAATKARAAQPARAHADDDAPPGFAGAAKDSAPVDVAAADDDTAAAAPAVADKAPEASHGDHHVRVRIGVLAGVVGRNLAVDPNTVQTYSSSPVGTGGFEGAVGIGPRIHIDGSFEHTLVMHTDVASGSASTAIGRAEGMVSYDVLHGSVAVAPVVGFGLRYFSIDSTSTARSPDTEYQYVMLGASVAKHVGSRWALRGLVAFEPVVGGLPAMQPAPSRWGFDLGAAVEVQATAHVFARAAFDYQSFAMSWDMKGGATDAYPSGTLGAGAAF
jgi:hypothetical protein